MLLYHRVTNLNTSYLTRQGAQELAFYFLFEYHAEGCSLGEKRQLTASAYPVFSFRDWHLLSLYQQLGCQGTRVRGNSRKGSTAADLPEVVRRPQMSSHSQECLLRRGRVVVETSTWNLSSTIGQCFSNYHTKQSPAGLVKVDYWVPTPTAN